MRSIKQTSNSQKVLLWNGVLNIWRKLTGEHPSGSVILTIKIIFRHGRSTVNLQRIFRTRSYKSMFWGLLLNGSDLTKTTNIFNSVNHYYYFVYFKMVSEIEMFNDANILQSMAPKHFKKNVQKEVFCRQS